MKIVIMGAGAAGSALATDLARSGDEVTMLVRERDLPDGGALKVSVDSPDGQEMHWAIVPAVSTVSETPEVIILCVRQPDLAEAATQAATIPGEAPIITIAPGPHAEEPLHPILAPPRIIPGLLVARTEYLQLGHIRAEGDLRLFIGGPANSATQALASSLQRAIGIEIVPDIMAARWSRWLVDLPDTLAALTNLTPAVVMANHRALNLLVMLLREASRVIEKAEIPLATLPDVDMAKLRRLHSMMGVFASRWVQGQPRLVTPTWTVLGTMAQGIKRGRSIEIDETLGEVVRLGQTNAIPTPASAAVIEAAHTVARSGKFLSADALGKLG